MKTRFGLPTLLCLLLPVAPLVADPAEPKFRTVEIDPKIEIGYGLALADVDGDKKPDILLADKNQIVWYQNPTWKKFVMTEKLTERDHVCIAARDIDGDGKAEVAAGAEWNPGDTVKSGSVHYLVAPADRTKLWEAVRLPHEPTVHRMHWVKSWQGHFELVVLPLHGRGNTGGKGDGVKMLAYKMPEDPKQPWTTRVLSDSLHMTHNFDPVGWDEDPAEEPIIASKEGVFVLNWQDEQLRQIELADGQGGGAGEVRLGRLPGGKRFLATVEPMHGNALVIYSEGDAEKLWKRNVIDEALIDGHAVACGDFLGAKGDQVVVGWRAMNRPGTKVGVALYTPMDAEGQKWRKTLVDDNTMACEDLRAGDLNADGKLDIVAAGRGTKNVKIYFNEGSTEK